jgi:anti-anti-sigma factor
MASQRDSAPLTLKLDRRGDGVRIRIAGDFAFGTSHRLGKMLDRLGDLRGQTLVLDLSATEFVDSSGLSALVAAKLRSDRDGFTLAIVEAPETVRRVLERTGLDRLLRPEAAEL